MLSFLLGRASPRKLWLFACASCRDYWATLADDQARRAVEAIEVLADGDASPGRYKELTLLISCPTLGTFYAQPEPGAPPFVIAGSRVMPSTTVCLIEALAVFNEIPAGCSGVIVEAIATNRDFVEYGAPLFRVVPADPLAPGEDALHGGLSIVRDLFGNPFQKTTVRPEWLNREVAQMARAAYDQRSLPAGALECDRLAVLADALEDAGCENADLLGHLRGPGPHYRSCFAVDLLLRRE
jgi:biotin carboxyl carrier protein